VPLVRDRYYADVTEPLVVLEIETDRLDCQVRDEPVGGEVYPHVYGPIPASAVVAWRPARLPPIELTARVPGPPLPATTRAYRAVAAIVGSAAFAAFWCAVVAQWATHDRRLPYGVSFVLWSLTVVLALPALVAVGYAEWARRHAAREDTAHADTPPSD
jgi:hypothetical protein